MVNKELPKLSLECPKCGKWTVVEHNGDYYCIACDFKRSLDRRGGRDKPERKNGEAYQTSLIVLAIIALLVVLVI